MVNNVLYVVVDVLARKERPASFTHPNPNPNPNPNLTLTLTLT